MDCYNNHFENISNIKSGVEFEIYIKKLLKDEGLRAIDTPMSNDYGSDIIIDYNNYRISIQCKFYTGKVGIKAIQEVMGSLRHYNADYGAVVTNSTFTQQAKNLARTNNILLVSGEDQFPSSKYLFDNSFSTTEKKSYQKESELTLDDLVIRYGVSRYQIMQYFMSRGLPYEKVGREYRFSLNEIERWEMMTQYIDCGRSGRIALPTYTQYYNQYMNRKYKYINNKLAELDEAKQRNDKESIKMIKAELRELGVKTNHLSKRFLVSIWFFVTTLLIIFVSRGFFY